MKKICFVLSAVVVLMVGCGDKREKAITKIDAAEKALSAMDISSDTSKAEEMVGQYRDFASQFPDDSLAPAYLQRAADLCINIGNQGEAIEILDSLTALYQGYEDLAGCYFLKGYAYETAEEYDKAKEAYTYYVENYPDHYLASDTRKMLPYIGMSPEEMFEAILANATDKNLTME